MRLFIDNGNVTAVFRDREEMKRLIAELACVVNSDHRETLVLLETEDRGVTLGDPSRFKVEVYHAQQDKKGKAK